MGCNLINYAYHKRIAEYSSFGQFGLALSGLVRAVFGLVVLNGTGEMKTNAVTLGKEAEAPHAGAYARSNPRLDAQGANGIGLSGYLLQ